MNQKEHLDRIVARCRELLAAAEERTPGRWEVCGATHVWSPEAKSNVATVSEPRGRNEVKYEEVKYEEIKFGSPNAHEAYSNATFIASCAGAAEAGWLATIVAIELIQQTMYREQGADYTPLSEEAAKQIIAAWPEELLS